MYWQVLHLHLMESPPQKKPSIVANSEVQRLTHTPTWLCESSECKCFSLVLTFRNHLWKKNRFSLLFSITKQHIGSKCLMKALRQTSSTSKLFFIYEDSYSAGLRELFIDTELLSIQHCCHCLIFFVLFVVLQKGLLSFYCVVSKCRCVNEGTFQCCWPVDELS